MGVCIEERPGMHWVSILIEPRSNFSIHLMLITFIETVYSQNENLMDQLICSHHSRKKSRRSDKARFAYFKFCL